MAKRNWKIVTNDLTLLFFGIQDARMPVPKFVYAVLILRGLLSLWMITC